MGELAALQRHHRIDSRGAASWNEARGGGHCQGHERYHGNNQQVIGPDAEEQRGHHAGRDRRQDDTDDESRNVSARPWRQNDRRLGPLAAPNAMRTPRLT
jgi:hypothetical protein